MESCILEVEQVWLHVKSVSFITTFEKLITVHKGETICLIQNKHNCRSEFHQKYRIKQTGM